MGPRLPVGGGPDGPWPAALGVRPGVAVPAGPVADRPGCPRL